MDGDSERRTRNVPGLALAAVGFGAIFTVAWTFLLMMVAMEGWDPEAFVLIGVIAGSTVGLRESRAALKKEIQARRDDHAARRHASPDVQE